ncbi:MAG: hypothetical protein KC561_01640 [Myxococcales bacterium]|nr:hypothetical protein [Myxococcales bacterium]
MQNIHHVVTHSGAHGAALLLCVLTTLIVACDEDSPSQPNPGGADSQVDTVQGDTTEQDGEQSDQTQSDVIADAVDDGQESDRD